MKDLIQDYHKNFTKLIASIEVTNDNNRPLPLFQGIEAACGIITEKAAEGGKVFFVGNGGSAAIASHMALDFWKNGNIPATSFNDGPLLTCIGNDFGYRHIFEKPIEMFANPGDVLCAISSSGRSENILKGVEAAQARGCEVVTFSGFTENNPLRSKGKINFYVPSMEYGPVEVIHQYICHWLLDMLMIHGNGNNCKG